MNRREVLAIGVDAVAAFMGLLGWVFITLVPVLFVLVFFIFRHRQPSASLLPVVAILLFLSAILVPLGFLIKWLAAGVIQRKTWRLVISALLFGTWGAWQLVEALHPPVRTAYAIFRALSIGIPLLVAALIICLDVIRCVRLEWRRE